MRKAIEAASWIFGHRSKQYNPYRIFTREQWARLRDDTPMTLEPGEFARLRSMHDRLDMKEVEDIYLPLSRLLSIYVDATQRLYQAQRQFLGIRDRKMPYIIGVAGSVAVGKSTTARVLQALLARWSPRPKVDLVTTDGFLFPECRAGAAGPDAEEGLSGELRPADAAVVSERHQGRAAAGARAGLFASDLRHRSEPVDRDRPAGHPDRRGRQRAADRPAAARRQGGAGGFGLLRFLGLYRRRRARCCATGTSSASWRCATPRFTDPRSYFHRYAPLSDEEATATALAIWERTNLANLEENILPTRPRATLILKKGADHVVEQVALRRL